MQNDISYKHHSKESRSDLLVSDKVDFRGKKITRDKVGHYIMIKRSVYQEDIQSYIYVYPKQQSCKIHKTKTDMTEREIGKSTL